MRRRTPDVLERGFTDYVLVCVNERDSEHACCADAGGRAVYDAAATWLRERDAFWTHVIVGTVSCLGLCSDGGAAVAIQPRNEWYSDVTPGDVPDLLEREFGPEAERLGVRPESSADAAPAPPNDDRGPRRRR